MDELRSMLGEYFFSRAREKQDKAGKKEEGKMKYPRRYQSLSEFEREELQSYKISWSIDDFFDEVFLSGEMDLEFADESEDRELDEDLDEL